MDNFSDSYTQMFILGNVSDLFTQMFILAYFSDSKDTIQRLRVEIDNLRLQVEDKGMADTDVELLREELKERYISYRVLQGQQFKSSARSTKFAARLARTPPPKYFG